MKLPELKGLKHPHILVRFLDGALGVMEEPYADPATIRIPRAKQGDSEYRKLPLFKVTHTGQGICVENKFTRNSRRALS